MKLTVHHLGIISEAEITIRPLTVFLGHNNTNKTWTAYSLYGLAAALSRSSSIAKSQVSLKVDRQLEERISIIAEGYCDQLKDFFLHAQEEPSKNLEGSEIRFVVRREDIISSTHWPIKFELASKELGKLLAVPEPDLNNALVSLELLQEEFLSDFDSVEFIYNPGKNYNEHIISSNNSRYGRYRSLWRTPDRAELVTKLKESIITGINRLVFSSFGFAVAFPAERKALVTSYATTSRQKDILRERPERDVPLPIGGFSQMLTRAEYLSEDRGTESTNEFHDLAELVERKIFNGQVTFKGVDTETQQSLGRRHNTFLNYSTNSQIDLKMHASASIIRSLAGLDVYLKTLCKAGDLIVIDEPEMNAHPEAQLAIVELLAAIANRGVTVVITTHSTYLADHLNVLIEVAKLPEEDKNSLLPEFKLGSSDSFIDQGHVSVYSFGQEGVVSDIFDRELGVINLSSFSESTSYLTDLYAKVLDLRYPQHPEK